MIKLTFCLVALATFLANPLPAQHSLDYESPDQPEYKDYERTSKYVWMSDSVRLAVDVYIPTNGPDRTEFPVVFKMTPYGRAYIGTEVGVLLRTLSWVAGMGWHPFLDQEGYSPSISNLLKHGYAIVAVDMRGTGASFGKQMPLDPQHGKDGKELVDWIAKQSFSNGKVGMIGKSYMAWAQFATAAEKPEALKCIAPEVIFMESYTASFKPGGIVAERWMNTFSDRLRSMNLNYSDIRKFYIPAAPVVDEDGDGRIHDEWPIIDSTILDADAQPSYRDGVERDEDLYWHATREHRGNISVADLMGDDFAYFDSETTHPDFAGYSYCDVAPGHFLESVHESGIPVFHIGRWYDGFLRGTTQLFASSQQFDNHRMLITPGFHMSRMSKQQSKFQGFDYKISDILPSYHLRFFDRYLKDIENGWDEEKPVTLFVVNDDWQQHESWPPKSSENKTFFLSDGRLGDNLPAEKTDTISVDTLHSSGYGKKELNRWTMASGTPKKPMERTDIDEHATIYNGSVLEEDLEMIGNPLVEIWVSSNLQDADVFVYLEEVDAKGRAYYVSEGQLRASWHKQGELAEQLGVSYTPKPELPWHCYTRDYQDDEVFESGEPVRLHFDLMPVGWKFKKGNRIRISLAGLDKGNFEINPAYYENGKLRGDLEIYLHQSPDYPSKVMLPLIGASQKDSKLEQTQNQSDGSGTTW